MSLSLPFSELEVIGFVGRIPPEDWPVRLIPVYRGRTQSLGLWSPFQEEGAALDGDPIPAQELEEMREEGEFTTLPTPFAAREDHLLWLDASGVRYAPRAEAERILKDICRKAVLRAMELGLSRRGAREQLFRSLRAGPTAVANALLAVHFQFADLSQARPLREDLAMQAHTPISDLERELVQDIASDKLGSEVATAIAMELGRARRDELASLLLQAARVSEPARRAARAAPKLSWDAVGLPA